MSSYEVLCSCEFSSVSVGTASVKRNEPVSLTALHLGQRTLGLFFSAVAHNLYSLNNMSLVYEESMSVSAIIES